MKLIRLFSLSLVFHVHLGYAQQLTETKILSADGSVNWFGAAVAIEGDYAIIGARLDDLLFENAGAAYVFQNDGNAWLQMQKIYASDAQEEFRFGRSVAMSGDYFIVGSHTANNGIGAAYVFARDGSEWQEQAKLTPGDGVSGDFFGTSVDISGDYAVVGAFGKDDTAGAAYVYFRQGTTWVEQTKLSPRDLTDLDRFGRSVAIDGQYIVVGSFTDDDLGNASGSAYVFERSGTSWIQTDKLTASDGSARDNFGVSVDVSGDYMIVGARNASTMIDTSGAAYVFTRNGSSWMEQARIEAADPAPGANFGVSVSISGTLAMVGARYDDDANGSGSAYIFERSGSNWTQAYKLVPSDADSGFEFGWNVSISNSEAIVGAHRAFGRSGREGAAYVYADIPTDVHVLTALIPENISLAQNHPNPFNPSTTIRYTLSIGADVRLTVHNLLGQEIRSLVSGYQTAGEYETAWNGRDSKGEEVSSGMYLYRLETGDYVQTRKMILLK